MRAVPLLIVLALLLALPAVPAQDHDHGAAGGDGVLLVADVPPDGRTRVGEITHFSYVVLDTADPALPQPHNDVHVTVTLNGAPFYTTHSAHDYDGVGGLDIVFPVPGTYEVNVTVPGDPPRQATYTGYIVPMETTQEVDLVLDAPNAATAGRPTTFTYHIADADGAIVPHTDALVEVRRVADDFPVLQVHTHTHEDLMSFDYAFEQAGTYLVRITGYTAFPTEDAPPFQPFTRTHLLTVTGEATPQPPLIPAAPSIATGALRTGPATAENHTTDAKTVRTITADPVAGTSQRVGPFSQVRMSHVTYEETTQELVQHLDYEATLTGPYGTVFRSASLHEYDGVLEIMSANRMIGDYTWDVQTEDGEAFAYTYTVLPANAPAFSAGPQFLDVTGLDRLVAGQNGPVDLFVHGAGDLPFQHGEIGVRLTDGGDVPLVQHKLHTHETGTFAFGYSPPAPGRYTLQVDPFDVHGAPTPSYHGATLGASRALDFTVTSGEGLHWTTSPVTERIHESTPMATPLVFLALLGVTIAVLARRP